MQNTPARPRLLDLFCCEGGAAVGYHRAGWDVVGVDLEQRFAKRYPFEFHPRNALTLLDELIAGKDRYGPFDAVHASPPCQHASAGTRALDDRDKYPRLIEPTRERLEALGLPYVIENVAGSALRDPVVLCGTMFGLRAWDVDQCRLELWRHRHFETNWNLTAPSECAHGWFSEQVAGVYGGARRVARYQGETLAELAPRDRDSARNDRHGGYVPRSESVQADLLGINWMTQHGRNQSVPPAYTEHVGTQLLAYLEDEGDGFTNDGWSLDELVAEPW